MKTTKQETRPGTEKLEEEDTYDLLDKLTPTKRKRCRGNTKPVGRTCVEAWKPQGVKLDNRVGVAVGRARDFVAGRNQREAEVKQAAEEVLLAARKSEGRAK
jgi:hypothetical protein